MPHLMRYLPFMQYYALCQCSNFQLERELEIAGLGPR